MRLTILAAVLCLMTAGQARAQSIPEVKLPASPRGQAAIQVGGTWTDTGDGGRRYTDGRWIVVDYGRPLLRGRANIFGSGADYGRAVSDGAPVWRAGANDTTTITTQVPLVVGGTRIEPGVYNVFVDLKGGQWTLVLNTQPRQASYDPSDRVNLFGAINYDASFDVARAPMMVDEGGVLNRPLEQFTIGFLAPEGGRVMLLMAWDRTVATVPLELAD